MNVDIYERLASIKTGIWLLAGGALIVLACVWQQAQVAKDQAEDLKILKLQVQKLERDLAVLSKKGD